MKILHIEDDMAAADATRLVLRSAGHVVEHVVDVADGLHCAREYEFDLIISDLDLPDATGFEFLRLIRLEKINTPVLILSSRAGIDEKVRAFEFGADDYLTKPYHNAELCARVAAISRRAHGFSFSHIEVGPLHMDLDRRLATYEGRALHFTGKEFAMVEALGLRRGRVMTKDQLLSTMYRDVDEPQSKIVDVFMCKIRKKLRAAGGDLIETVWGRGYVMREPDVSTLDGALPTR